MNNKELKALPFGHNPDTPANIEGLEVCFFALFFA